MEMCFQKFEISVCELRVCLLFSLRFVSSSHGEMDTGLMADDEQRSLNGYMLLCVCVCVSLWHMAMWRDLFSMNIQRSREL